MNNHQAGKNLVFFPVAPGTGIELPIVHTGISAGFPSPAEDFIDTGIDLIKELIRNPDATFYARVKGSSMQDANIFNGDLLIIDKSLPPANGKVAICFIDGEFTVKKIKLEKGICWLMPANPDYKPVRVTADNDFMVWGIVVHVIRTL